MDSPLDHSAPVETSCPAVIGRPDRLLKVSISQWSKGSQSLITNIRCNCCWKTSLWWISETVELERQTVDAATLAVSQVLQHFQFTYYPKQLYSKLDKFLSCEVLKLKLTTKRLFNIYDAENYDVLKPLKCWETFKTIITSRNGLQGEKF